MKQLKRSTSVEHYTWSKAFDIDNMLILLPMTTTNDVSEVIVKHNICKYLIYLLFILTINLEQFLYLKWLIKWSTCLMVDLHNWILLHELIHFQTIELKLRLKSLENNLQLN